MEMVLFEKQPIIFSHNKDLGTLEVSKINSTDKISFLDTSNVFFLSYNLSIITNDLYNTSTSTQYIVVSHLGGSEQRFLGNMSFSSVSKSPDAFYIAIEGVLNGKNDICVRELVSANSDICYSLHDLLDRQNLKGRKIIKYNWNINSKHELYIETVSKEGIYEYFSFDPWFETVLTRQSFAIKEKVYSDDFYKNNELVPNYHLNISKLNFIFIKKIKSIHEGKIILPLRAEKIWWMNRRIAILKQGNIWYVLNVENKTYAKLTDAEELFFAGKDRVVPKLAP